VFKSGEMRRAQTVFPAELLRNFEVVPAWLPD
jgi:hypothetical protein